MTTRALSTCPISADPLHFDTTENGLGWTVRCFACSRGWSLPKSFQSHERRALEHALATHACRGRAL